VDHTAGEVQGTTEPDATDFADDLDQLAVIEAELAAAEAELEALDASADASVPE
jgi:hypothetical protein